MAHNSQESTLSSSLQAMSMNEDKENGLSPRGQDLIKWGGVRKHFSTIWENTYHIERNPSGVIDLGTAENYIMMEEVAKFVNEKVRQINSRTSSSLQL
jgi:hypothetical protein